MDAQYSHFSAYQCSPAQLIFQNLDGFHKLQCKENKLFNKIKIMQL